MSSYHPKAGYFTELVRTWMELKEVCISPDVGARTRAAFKKSDEDLEEDFINFELYEPMFMNAATKKHKKEAEVWLIFYANCVAEALNLKKPDECNNAFFDNRSLKILLKQLVEAHEIECMRSPTRRPGCFKATRWNNPLENECMRLNKFDLVVLIFDINMNHIDSCCFTAHLVTKN